MGESSVHIFLWLSVSICCACLVFERLCVAMESGASLSSSSGLLNHYHVNKGIDGVLNKRKLDTHWKPGILAWNSRTLRLLMNDRTPPVHQTTLKGVCLSSGRLLAHD